MKQELHSSVQGTDQHQPNYVDPYSPTSSKNLIIGEVKKVDQNLLAARNRVSMLRNQLQQEKKQIKKNEQLVKQVLKRKTAANQINSYKNRDNSSELNRISELKRRNQSLRLSHEKSLEDIRKAIYLVKLDDAREVKNVSEKLRRQMREHEGNSAVERQINRQNRKKQAQRAKERYMKYWKSKLQEVYSKNDEYNFEMMRSKEKKQNQIKELEEEQIKLLQQIEKYHEKKTEAKKEYLAALSLSPKDVAQAMNTGDQMQKSISAVEIRTKTPKLQKKLTSERLPNFGPKVRVPNAHVDQNKLKIILKELKRIDKNKQSQRYQIESIEEEDLKSSRMKEQGV